MVGYTIMRRNKFFEVLGDLNRENRSDNKVAMVSELDMTSAETLRLQLESLGGSRPSYTALVAKAVSAGLAQHPQANRIPLELPFFRRLVQLNDVHMTIAVTRDRPGEEQAVFAGTIRHTDTKDLQEISDELQTLANATPETNPRWALMSRIVKWLPTPLARLVLSLPRLWPSLWVAHRGGAVMISSPAKYGVDTMYRSMAMAPWILVWPGQRAAGCSVGEGRRGSNHDPYDEL